MVAEIFRPLMAYTLIFRNMKNYKSSFEPKQQHLLKMSKDTNMFSFMFFTKLQLKIME